MWVAHRNTRDKREADRIKATALLASGWTAKQVVKVLLVDLSAVRNHFKLYRQRGLQALGHFVFRGIACVLDKEQLDVLDTHLQAHLYVTV